MKSRHYAYVLERFWSMRGMCSGWMLRLRWVQARDDNIMCWKWRRVIYENSTLCSMPLLMRFIIRLCSSFCLFYCSRNHLTSSLCIMQTTNQQILYFSQHHQCITSNIIITPHTQTDLRRHPRSILRPSRTLQSRRRVSWQKLPLPWRLCRSWLLQCRNILTPTSTQSTISRSYHINPW